MCPIPNANIDQTTILEDKLAVWVRSQIKENESLLKHMIPGTKEHNQLKEEIEFKKKLENEFKNEGHCVGFTWIKRVSDRTGVNKLLEQKLQIISDWDTRNPPTKQQNQLMEELSQQILLAQQSFEAWDKEFVQNATGIAKDQNSSKIPASIMGGNDNADVFHTFTAPSEDYTAKEFKALLDRHADPNTMISLGGFKKNGGGHAMDLQIVENDKGTRTYLFYDPNSKTGVREFEDFEKFYEVFKKDYEKVDFNLYEIEDYKANIFDLDVCGDTDLDNVLHSKMNVNDVLTFENEHGGSMMLKKVDHYVNDEHVIGYELRDENHKDGKPQFFRDSHALFSELDNRMTNWRAEEIEMQVARRVFANEHVKEYAVNKLIEYCSTPQLQDLHANEIKQMFDTFMFDKSDLVHIDRLMRSDKTEPLMRKLLPERLDQLYNSSSEPRMQFAQELSEKYNLDWSPSQSATENNVKPEEDLIDKLAQATQAISSNKQSIPDVVINSPPAYTVHHAIHKAAHNNKTDDIPSIRQTEPSESHEAEQVEPTASAATSGPKTPELHATDHKNSMSQQNGVPITSSFNNVNAFARIEQTAASVLSELNINDVKVQPISNGFKIKGISGNSNEHVGTVAASIQEKLPSIKRMKYTVKAGDAQQAAAFMVDLAKSGLDVSAIKIKLANQEPISLSQFKESLGEKGAEFESAITKSHVNKENNPRLNN